MAVFDQKCSGMATLVSSSRGGAGKTCARRGVGLHEDTSERFSDGIFYMSLGAELVYVELIQSNAVLVRRSGSYKS